MSKETVEVVSASPATTKVWVGVDFSGDYRKFGRNVQPQNQTVWIAEIHEIVGVSLRLNGLFSAQSDCEFEHRLISRQLPPFQRLVRLLQSDAYNGVGIDAPFSIPARHLPDGRWTQLKQRITEYVPAAHAKNQIFPTGEWLLDLARNVAPLESRKPLRQTEMRFRAFARSTLWNGVRPGAPFASSCIRLLAESGKLCWPFEQVPVEASFVCEAFPAAQLEEWRCDRDGYNGVTPLAKQRRMAIVNWLVAELKLSVTKDQRKCMVSSADALDAVICAFAPRAVALNSLAFLPEPEGNREGWIAVQKNSVENDATKDRKHLVDLTADKKRDSKEILTPTASKAARQLGAAIATAIKASNDYPKIAAYNAKKAQIIGKSLGLPSASIAAMLSPGTYQVRHAGQGGEEPDTGQMVTRAIVLAIQAAANRVHPFAGIMAFAPERYERITWMAGIRRINEAVEAYELATLDLLANLLELKYPSLGAAEIADEALIAAGLPATEPSETDDW